MKRVLVALVVGLQSLAYYAPVQANEVSLLISELRTQGASSSDELVEIHNPSSEFVYLNDYKIVYLTATTDIMDPDANLRTLVQLEGWLAPGAFIYFVNSDHPDAEATGTFASNLANTSGHVAITSVNETEVYDLVGWGDALSAEGEAAPNPSTEESLQRLTFAETLTVDEEEATAEEPQETTELDSEVYTEQELNQLVDTNNNLADFKLAAPDPLNTNVDPPDDIIPPGEEPEEAEEPIDPDAAFTGLQPAVVTELLPDPKSPVTDAEGEFIELYNPNPVAIILTDITLQTGSTFSKSQSLSGVSIDAGGYVVLYSGSNSFNLSNAGSSVRLVLPSGAVWGSAVAYPKVKAGESYALFEGGYKFTIELTPGAANIYRQPVTVVKAAKTSKTTKRTSSYVDPSKFTVFKPIIITELLPDPAKPLKDSEAEFVEIYNPNESEVDLEGLILETGSSYSYSYTFKKGQKLEPGAYLAVFSKDTGLTLANSGGAARILLPNGQQWGEPVSYDEAEEGESYALTETGYEWTSQPSPGNKNIVAAATQAEPEPEASSQFQDEYQEPPEVASTMESWFMVGGVGLTTVLYSGYEYRKDVANKIWQYRRNRRTRR